MFICKDGGLWAAEEVHSHRRSGFTLIELLVVIAIISILASMLFPTFSRAQGKGRQAACLSNVKQIALALTMYAQDYDEVYPRGQSDANDINTQWYNAIFPYTHNRQIMFCPDRKDRGPGYAMNYLVSGISVGSFWDAASKIVCGDVRPEAIGANGTVGEDSWWINDPNNDLCMAPADNSHVGNNWPQRHNDGIIYGFADGHVKWAREEQLDTAVYWVPSVASE